MLLRKLVEFSERIHVPPRFYAETPIRYRISLDSRGRVLSPTPIDTLDNTSRTNRRGERRPAPQITRSSGVSPLLLADNSEYTFGLAAADSKPERVRQCHEAYLDVVHRCAVDTRDPRVGALDAWLHTEPLADLDLPADFDAKALVTFLVDGVYLIDLPEVQAFWMTENEPTGTRMQCVVCGNERPVLDTLPGKVKGVPGGQTAGTAIISANALAFESYGLERSLIAPTCAICAERFTLSANTLLRDEHSSIRLGGAAYAWWTRADVDFTDMSLLSMPDAGAVRSLIDSARVGGRATTESIVDSSEFYAVSLSGSGGRTVVRDWIDTTVGNVKSNLARWFIAQAIVDNDGGPSHPLGVYALCASTLPSRVRDANKELRPPMVRSVLRAALTGSPLEIDLLERAVRRCRVEGRVTRPRAALIKLVLSRVHQWEGATMVQLEPDSPNIAYRCGRLLAVLEEVQRQSLGDVNSTVVDRFFASACAAPGSVFQRLLLGARPHLAKLRRDRPGVYVALERRLEDILKEIPAGSFPRVLTLPDQGQFVLGFYHQRAHDREQARLGAERRRQSASDATLDTVEQPS
jgi:CRISPR-associated protein Csd1